MSMEVCSICLNTYHNPVQLECGHVVDKKCWENWVVTRRNQNKEPTCPIDQRIIKTFDSKVTSRDSIKVQLGVDDVSSVSSKEDIHFEVSKDSKFLGLIRSSAQVFHSHLRILLLDGSRYRKIIFKSQKPGYVLIKNSEVGSIENGFKLRSDLSKDEIQECIDAIDRDDSDAYLKKFVEIGELERMEISKESESKSSSE